MFGYWRESGHYRVTIQMNVNAFPACSTSYYVSVKVLPLCLQAIVWPLVDFRNFHVFPCDCVFVRASVCVCVWVGGGGEGGVHAFELYACLIVCVRVSGLTEFVSLLCNALCAPLWRNSA